MSRSDVAMTVVVLILLFMMIIVVFQMRDASQTYSDPGGSRGTWGVLV